MFKTKQIVWHSSLLLLLPLLLLLLTTENAAATKLNLAEACADRESYFCTITNVTDTFADPLLLANTTSGLLVGLIFRSSVMGRVPREIFELKTRLRTFIMHDCGLNRLTDKDFAAAKQLRRLILQQNRLFILPEKAFSEAVMLRELHLIRNTISIVHRSAFDGLTYLRYLDLQQNTIRSLPEQLFDDLTELEHVDLSNNELETIDANTFRNNSKLRTLLLYANPLYNFAPRLLEHLPHLNILDLSSSNVRELYLQSVDTLFVQNCQLTKLFINGSVIKVHAGNNLLEELSIADKLSVRELDLRGNIFAEFDSFLGMRNLQHLDVSKNKITRLHTMGIPQYLPLSSLTYLNLGSNKLEHNLGNEDFLMLPKLVHLDLSFNDLRWLDESLFEPLYNLEKFYIEGNQLHQFDYERFLHAHVYLRELGLFLNDWEFRYFHRMTNFLKDNMHIQLPMRFNAAECHNGSSSLLKSTNAPNANSEELTDVSGIHPYWTARDILAMFILIVVLCILLLQLYSILREEGCLHSRCCERIERLNGITTSQTQPQRLHEDDSEV